MSRLRRLWANLMWLGQGGLNALFALFVVQLACLIYAFASLRGAQLEDYVAYSFIVMFRGLGGLPLLGVAAGTVLPSMLRASNLEAMFFRVSGGMATLVFAVNMFVNAGRLGA